MAIFTFAAPDGKEYDIEAPEGATQDEALDYLVSNWDTLSKSSQETAKVNEPIAKDTTPVQEQQPQSIDNLKGEDVLKAIGGTPSQETGDFARGFQTAYKQLPQLGYGLEAGAAAAGESVFGEGGMLTNAKKEAVAKYEQAGKELEATAKPTDSATYSFEKAQQGDYGSLVDTLQYGLGYGAGQLTQGGLASIGGKLVGKAVARATAENIAEKMVAEETAKWEAKVTAGTLTEEQLKSLGTQEVAKKMAEVGSKVALGSQAFGMEAGEIGGDLAKQSVNENRTLTTGEVVKGLGSAIAATALEYGAYRFTLGALTGKGSLTDVGKYTEGLKGNLLRGAGLGVSGVGVEGGTEFAQTLIEEAGKGKDPFSSESLRQAIDAAALGGIGGGGISAIGGALSPAQQKPDQPATGEIDPSMLSGGLPNTNTQTTAQQPAQTSSDWQRTMGDIRNIVGENQLVDNETIAKDIAGAENIDDAIQVFNHVGEAITTDHVLNMEQVSSFAQDLTKTDTEYLDNKDYQDAVQLENQLSTVRDQLAYNKFQTAFEESNQQASRAEFNALVEQEINNKNQQLKDLIQYQSDERARKAEVEASVPSINKALEDAQWVKTRNNRNAVIQMVFDRNVPAENIFPAIKAELKRQGFKDTELSQDDIDSYNLLKAYDQNNPTIAKEPVSFGGQPVAARSASDVEFYNTGTNKVDKQGNIIADALGEQGANAGEQFTGGQGQDVVTNFVSPETPVRQESDALRKVDEWVNNGATYKNGMLFDSKGKKFVLNTVQREYYLNNKSLLSVAKSPVALTEQGYSETRQGQDTITGASSFNTQALKEVLDAQIKERVDSNRENRNLSSVNQRIEEQQWIRTRNNRNAAIQSVFDKNVSASNIKSAIKAELKRQGFKDTELSEDDINAYELLQSAYARREPEIANAPVDIGVQQPVSSKRTRLVRQGVNAGEQVTQGQQGQDVVTNFVEPSTPVRQESDSLRKVDEWLRNGATYKNGMLIDSKGKKFLLNKAQRDYYLENRATPIAKEPVDMGEVGNAPRKRYIGVKQQGVNAGEQITGSVGQDQISGVEEKQPTVQPVAKKKPATNNLRAITGLEPIEVAIGKLGGINREIANREGFSDFKGWYFTKKSKQSFDGMAEILRGYDFDISGGNDLVAQLRQSLDAKLFGMGQQVYTPQGYENLMNLERAEEFKAFEAEQKELAKELSKVASGNQTTIDEIQAAETPEDFDKLLTNIVTLSEDEADDFWNSIGEENADQTTKDASIATIKENAPEILSTYTEQEVTQREEAQKAAEKEQVVKDAAAERKRQADNQVDSVVDEMLGRGMTTTKDIFAPERKPKFSKAKAQERLAPNGKPSNLNATQYEQVRTPEFKEWFGDWENDPENASKVVDENGEPLVVYHGTDANVSEFITTGVGKTSAAYFTNLPEIANTYVRHVSSTLYPVFLNIKKIVDVDANGANWNKIDDAMIVVDDYEDSFNDYIGAEYGEEISTDDIVNYAKKANDGAVIRNVVDMGSNSFRMPNKESNVYAVFNPNQIKSATGNTGAFSKELNDIRFSQAQESTDNHTEQSLKEGLTQAGDDAYGKGWTDRLLATGMFEIISDADAQAIIEESSGAKFALVGDRSAANTQIDTTMGAYAAVARNLFAKIPNLKNILDYGAGKGRGTASVFRALKNKSIDANVKSYEPFPENWAKSLTEEPDYTNADNIKDGSQDAVVNLNVLNVVPRAIRDDIVKNIGRVLKDGGIGVISSRRWKGDVDTIKPANSRPGEEPNSFYVTRKLKGEIQTNYQKGIEPDELVAYVQELLPNFDVRKINGYGASAVIIQKPNGTPLLDSILKSEKTQSKGTGSESTLELRKEAKDLGAGERYSAFGVGKKMGDEVYLHRDYEDVLPQGDLADAKERIGDFEYNLIRYNSKTGAIGFFNSPDFDTSPEPVNGELMVVEPDGSIRNVPLNKDLDKQAIYHHKWQWVKDDYTGFDVAQSIDRSIEWQKVVNREGINRKRIGFQGVWQNEVLKPFDIKYSINGEIEAFFNPADGKTYFVAENIDKATDLHYLMMHEVGVHALNMGGNKEEFESILKQVDNLVKVKNPAALKGRQDALDADTPQEDLREETLAYLLKYAPKLKVVERFKAWLKNALRNMGKMFPASQKLSFIQWANKLSDQDLLYIANATLRKAPQLLLKKSSEYEVAQAQEYFDRTGFMPYLSEGQLEIPVELAKFAIKTAAQAKWGIHSVLGIPMNKNETVSLYYPTTNEIARRVLQEGKLVADNPNANRIYLTNESAGYSVMENRGAITNEMDGAVVLLQIDPSLVQIDDSVEHKDGRRDFFIPIGEGEAFMKKPKMLKLFTLNQPREQGIAETTTLTEVGERIAKAVEEYKGLTDRQKATRYTRAKKVLKRYHNITTFLTENRKLEKTRVGDYGLTYEGNSVASQGLGLASAQKINNKNLSTCPVSAICEELCLGETSGQNLLYGGKGKYRSGARLSQYLKTEAMVLHPEEFAIAIAHEIKLYESWANQTFEYVRDPANPKRFLRDPVTNDRLKIDKEIYQPAMRLNVTSDIPPTVFEPIMRAYPNVEFYDYTKLNSDSKLPNLHITYSSTGVSQIVDGVPIFNKHSNWRQSVQRLDTGFNVAMVFSDKNDMPKTVTDEATGKVYQVWNGDNYDARFLDPKRDDGIGMIVGLTNKDNTGGVEDATERTKGFFVNYNKKRDGDNVTILDQSKFNARAETYNGEKVTPSIKFSKSKKVKEGEIVNRSTGYTAYDQAKPIQEEVDNKANYPEGVSLEEERDWLMQQLRRFDSFRKLNDKSNELINKYLTTMGRLPELGNYLGLRYQTLGKIDNVDDIVRNVFDTLQKATKEDSKEIYTYLTDNKATTEFIIDPQMALMAKDLKEAITIIGKKLVEFNIIPMESFQMYEGRYLPRVYLEHIIQSSDRYQSLGSGKTLSPMGYAKRRDNNLPEEFRRLIKGEIKNTAYLASRTLSIPLRDIAMMEFFNQISDNEKWVWKQSLITVEIDAKTNRPTAIFDDDGVINYNATNSALEGKPKKVVVRKVTPYFLDKEADRILDQSYSAPEEDRKDMQDLANMMKRAASQAMVNMDAVPADFMKMPNIAKYGSLRGLVVHKLIYDDLVGTINTYGAAGEQTALENFFGNNGILAKITSAFKFSHVAINIPTQVTNLLSNGLLLHMSGVRFDKVPVRVTQAFKEVLNDGENYKKMIAMGGRKATFSNQELSGITEWLLENEAEFSDKDMDWFSVVHIMRELSYLAGKTVRSANNLHQNIEMVFKVAKFIDMKAKGANDETAAVMAHQALFDYSFIPRWAKWLRTVPMGIPFITWTIKSFEATLRTAANRPTTFLPYYMLGYAMSLAAGADFGDDGEDKLKAILKLLPERMQRGGSIWILPIRDDAGRTQLIDMKNLFPWGKTAEAIDSLSKLVGNQDVAELRNLADSVGVFSSPITQAVVAIDTNKDAFTGKQIVDENDPPAAKLQSILEYTYGMMSPPMLGGKGDIATLVKSQFPSQYEGIMNKDGSPKKTEQQAFIHLFTGLSIKSVDSEFDRHKKLEAFNNMITGIKAQRTRELHANPNLNEEARRNVREKYDARIERVKEKKQKFKDETDILK